MKNIIRFAAIISLSVFATACSNTASTENMVVKPAALEIPVSQKYKGAMAVRNVGGSEANPFWMAQVDGTSFKEALEQSLVEMGYAAPAGKKPRYFIDAELKSLDQPYKSREFDVGANVIYRVEKNGAKNAAKKTYPVHAKGTASASDAFSDSERLRIASERAIQGNLKEFFRELSE